MTDSVNHPSHYARFKFTCEPKDFTKFLPHPLASAVEYVIRAPYKGNEVEDLQKAVFWLHELLTTDYYWGWNLAGCARPESLILYCNSERSMTEYRAALYGLACNWPEITELIRSMDTPELISKAWVDRFKDYVGDRIALLLGNGGKR